VRALDTACRGESIFARVCRYCSIFPTTAIRLPESTGPGVGGAAGQRPAGLPADVVGSLVLPA